MKKYFSLFILPLLCFCGGNPTLQMALSGTAAFADANVKDIVFTIQNSPTAEGGLDQDGDGVADTFVYPTACGATMPANCGFPATSGEVEVGDLPLDYTYIVTVQLRDSAGNVLYDGQTTFENKKNAATVNIAID